MTPRWIVAIVVVAAIVVSGCSYQTATAPTGSLTLYATFDDAQDLTPGHNVQASGVVVGSVREVELDGYRARVRLSIEDGRNVPVGTTAVVKRTSLLGEHYVDLDFPERFDTETGPFVTSGTELEGSAQLDVEQLTMELAKVVGAVSADDLTATVQAGVEALGGRGQTLNQIVADAAAITEVVANQHDDVEAAIDATADIASTFAPEAERLGRLLEEISAVTEQVAGDRDRMVAALDGLDRLVTAADTTILKPNQDELERLFANFRTVSGELAARSDTLAQLVVQLENFTFALPEALYNGRLLLLTWGYLQGVPVLDPEAGDDPLGALLDLLRRTVGE